MHAATQFAGTFSPSDPLKAAEDESRRFQRVRVDLLGRYMLPDRREFTCQVTEMSPGGAVLMAPCPGRIDDKVIAYVDHVGRIEGYVRRTYPGGFMMSVEANAMKRERLAEQLTWLANRSMLGMSDDREHERVTPARKSVTVMPLGQPKVGGKVIDISVTGIAVETTAKVAQGDIVYINKALARVVRDLGYGFAAEFAKQQTSSHVIELAADLGVDHLFMR